MENLGLTNVTTEAKRLKQEVRKQTLGYIMAALGFVAGLAWNDAIKSIIEAIFPLGTNWVAKLIYAILVTVLVVIISSILLKNNSQDKL
ncbi:MAG: DUF5654 family protein [Candidatus Buchananbacteria bacterium]